MNPQLFTFLLGVFITMYLYGAIVRTFRKRNWSDLEKKIKQHDKEIDWFWTAANRQADDIADIKKLSNNTDSGLQSLYEIVRVIDKDVKRLKKKVKGIPDKDIDIIRDNYVRHYESAAKIDKMQKCIESLKEANSPKQQSND